VKRKKKSEATRKRKW